MALNGQLITDLTNFKSKYTDASRGNIEFKQSCADNVVQDGCNEKTYCKWSGGECVDDSPLTNIETGGDDTDKLRKILLTRQRMLDINFHKNDIKNKKIYTMFVFIIIIVLVMTIIHFKNSK